MLVDHVPPSGVTPVTLHDFDLSEVLSALQSDESDDLVRHTVSLVYQALIDAEATEVVQAEHHERTLARTTKRNGPRPPCTRLRPVEGS